MSAVSLALHSILTLNPPPVTPPSERCRLAAAGFVAAENVTEEQCRGDAVRFRWNRGLLPYICPLVARKFGNETVDAVMHVLTQARCCDNDYTTGPSVLSDVLGSALCLPCCSTSCCRWHQQPTAMSKTSTAVRTLLAGGARSTKVPNPDRHPCSWTASTSSPAKHNRTHSHMCAFRRTTVSVSSSPRPRRLAPAAGGATAP